jgi:hypothetical protein
VKPGFFWRLMVVSALAVTLAASGMAVSSAAASSGTAGIPGGFASWDELFAVQGRMNDALAAVESVAGAHGYDGMGGAIAAPENRELRVFWHGAVPGPVQQVISDWQKVVPVHVFPARFSREQMWKVQQRFLHVTDVLNSGPKPDGSGITIHVSPGQRLSPALAQQISASNVDLDVVDDGAPERLMDRYNDSPPYYAGARFWTNSGGICTAGFAVKNSAGTYMFTAGHCLHYSASPAEVVKDGGGDIMGTTYRDNDTRDIGLIATTTMGLMWDGGIYSANIKPVQSVTKSSTGNWLCTSGAATGTHCGIQVKAIDQYPKDRNGVTHGPLVMAEQVNHAIASGSGDSGGPVFELPSPDNGKVIAKGIISGGDDNTSVSTGCPSLTTCTWRLWYADMQESLGWYGLTLVTG